MKDSNIDGVTIIAGKTGDGLSKTLSDAQKQFFSSSVKACHFDEPIEYEINPTSEE
jgi:type II secretory ATPase GspE/PulE/Tfp pilus assembly ATPase PilB-like protein